MKKIKERDQRKTQDHQFKILSMCNYLVKVKIKCGIWLPKKDFLKLHLTLRQVFQEHRIPPQVVASNSPR